MARVIMFGDIKVDSEVRIDPDIISICESSDLVMANLEGPFVKFSKPRKDKKGRPLSSNGNIEGVINDLKINILNFGNNHILDFGLEGLNETINLADSMGVNWLGASDGKIKDKYFYIDEINKVAMLSFAHREGPMAGIELGGVGPYALPDFKLIEKHIKKYAAQGYTVIVQYHGGEEFFNYPWPRRYAWSEELIKAGALLVIGHHSHSVQPVSKVDGGYLALGLGNTYFHTPYQERHIGTREGVFLEIDTDTNLIKYHYIESDWSAARLNLSSRKNLHPGLISKTDLVRLWCKEARRKVFFNNLNVKNQDKNIFKRVAKNIYIFLILFKSAFSSVRDKDILIGSIPFFGKYILSRSIIKNPKNFKF